MSSTRWKVRFLHTVGERYVGSQKPLLRQDIAFRILISTDTMEQETFACTAQLQNQFAHVAANNTIPIKPTSLAATYSFPTPELCPPHWRRQPHSSLRSKFRAIFTKD